MTDRPTASLQEPPARHSTDPDPPVPPGRRTKIRFDAVRKEFTTRKGSVTAVDDVSLDIADGEFFMIVGPSGCGKTTLLRMIAGLEEPTGGRIDIAATSTDRPEMSMIFQGDSLFPWMTVWDNASYGLRMRNVPKTEIHDVVGHYLARTGLSRFADSYPHQLSGGMRQRVGIARAFANDPEVLLMDEPFSALDEQNKLLLQGELLRIWEETRKTVLFITHSVDEAVSLGDRVMVMTAHPGREKATLDVPFSRPRDMLALRTEPTYGELVFHIWGLLRDEVNQAQAEEMRR
ncbi:ABC transporter ATP-binding protein [Pseudonocardia hydrocarbonoxydans]|uniref:ABC transporter ATP-binding protein n=1 Tax=Pseudonocardia hydrocarbonoxydans TaxID=76726 RepID=A0A4Y3WGR0_9PSEU|nr:ABC transporter ATP-binding protein [Pseudonocardia hydrocarbonoxydans]GEC18034.1 ABC transporter ATP-binding protein [Pseudonocardia hydrocarbonoxydans]